MSLVFSVVISAMRSSEVLFSVMLVGGVGVLGCAEKTVQRKSAGEVPDAHIARLMGELNSPDLLVRRRAARYLRSAGKAARPALGLLIEKLDDKGETELHFAIRHDSAQAIRILLEDSEVQTELDDSQMAIIMRSAADEDPLIRLDVVWLLGALRTRRMEVTSALKTLQKDKDLAVAKMAEFRLQKMSGE